MDLNELRKNYKAKHRESVKNADSGSVKDFALANKKITDMSESSDVSVAFISNGSFYFCFGETGQKLKIPISSFMDDEGILLSIEGIVNKIDSMQISSPNRPSEDLSVYKYCKSSPAILKSAEIIFILYNEHTESYLNAIDLFEENKDIIPSRLIAESKIAAFGAIVRNAYCETKLAYEYRNYILDVNTGDGIIALLDSKKSSGYITPSIKDIIKGCVIQYNILKGLISDLLFLSSTSFNLSFVLYENDRVRDVKQCIVKNTTLPTRKHIDLFLESNQIIRIEIDDVVVTCDIRQSFDEISYVEVYANEDVLIYGKKEKNDVCIPLSTLIRIAPR